jgi:hypothetical protein
MVIAHSRVRESRSIRVIAQPVSIPARQQSFEEHFPTNLSAAPRREQESHIMATAVQPDLFPDVSADAPAKPRGWTWLESDFEGPYTIEPHSMGYLVILSATGRPVVYVDDRLPKSIQDMLVESWTLRSESKWHGEKLRRPV